MQVDGSEGGPPGQGASLSKIEPCCLDEHTHSAPNSLLELNIIYCSNQGRIESGRRAVPNYYTRMPGINQSCPRQTRVITLLSGH